MKARFEGELILHYLDEPVNGKWFKVAELFIYWAEDGRSYTVPNGVHTDFASIPRGFRWLISRVGRYGLPAVFHDYLCEYGIVSRKEADRLFLESMKSKGVGWLKRRTMYFGTRLYSIVTFKK